MQAGDDKSRRAPTADTQGRDDADHDGGRDEQERDDAGAPGQIPVGVCGHDPPELTTGVEDDELTAACALPDVPVAVELVDEDPVEADV